MTSAAPEPEAIIREDSLDALMAEPLAWAREVLADAGLGDNPFDAMRSVEDQRESKEWYAAKIHLNAHLTHKRIREGDATEAARFAFCCALYWTEWNTKPPGKNPTHHAPRRKKAWAQKLARDMAEADPSATVQSLFDRLPEFHQLDFHEPNLEADGEDYRVWREGDKIVAQDHYDSTRQDSIAIRTWYDYVSEAKRDL